MIPSASAGTAYVSIRGDFGPLNTGLRRSQGAFGNSLNQMESRSQRAFRRIGAFARIGAVAGIAGIGIAAKKAFSEFEEAERATKQTEAVLKSTGGAANVSAKHIEALANAVSKKSGKDDEAVQAAENLLLTFTSVRNEVGKGNDIFDQATHVIADMSAALGQDFKASTIQVGKALQDPIKGITALRRVGVNFNEQQTEQVKKMVESGRQMDAQKFILRELRTEFEGSAAAQATASDKLRVAIDNVLESLGRAFAPALEKAAKAVSLFLDDVNAVLQRGDLTPGQKFDRIGDLIAAKLEAALPVIAGAAAKIAPKVALAFVKGLLNAPPLVQLFTGAWLLKKAAPLLGAAGLLGKQSGAAFSAGMATTAAQGSAVGTLAGAAAGSIGGRGVARQPGPTRGGQLAYGPQFRSGAPVSQLGPARGLTRINAGLTAMMSTLAAAPFAWAALAASVVIAGDKIKKSKTFEGILGGKIDEKAAKMQTVAISGLRAGLDQLTAASQQAQATLPGVAAAEENVARLRKAGKTDTRAYTEAVRALDAVEGERIIALRHQSEAQKRVAAATRQDVLAAQGRLGLDRKIGASSEKLKADAIQLAQALSRQASAQVNVSRGMRGLTAVTGPTGTKMGALLKTLKGVAGFPAFKKLLITADVSQASAAVRVVENLRKLGREKTALRIIADSKTPEEALRRLRKLTGDLRDREHRIRMRLQDEATQKLERLKRLIGDLPSAKRFTLIIKEQRERSPGGMRGLTDDLLPRRQRGGIIPGHGDGDKVPVLAEPGEGFINKRAVRALGGPRAIERINRALPRFQGGGVVQRITQRLIPAAIPQPRSLTQRIRQQVDVFEQARAMGIPEFKTGGIVRRPRRRKRPEVIHVPSRRPGRQPEFGRSRERVRAEQRQRRVFEEGERFAARQPLGPSIERVTTEARQKRRGELRRKEVRQDERKRKRVEKRRATRRSKRMIDREPSLYERAYGEPEYGAIKRLQPRRGFLGAALEKLTRSPILEKVSKKSRPLGAALETLTLGGPLGTVRKVAGLEEGARVIQKGTRREGTVVETRGLSRKVKWDDGGSALHEAVKLEPAKKAPSHRVQRSLQMFAETFSKPIKVKRGKVTWKKGEWGRGLITADGELHVWPEAWAHHRAYKGREGISGTVDEFSVTPQGKALLRSRKELRPQLRRFGIMEKGGTVQRLIQGGKTARVLVGEQGPELVRAGRESLRRLLYKPAEALSAPRIPRDSILVGQKGPEIVDLPVGARVIPHLETQQLLGQVAQQSGPSIFERGVQALALGGTVRKKDDEKDPTARGKGQPDREAKGGRGGEVPFKAPKVGISRIPGGVTARANKLDRLKLPYKYGGGHGNIQRALAGGGMDCSASVSYVLGIPPRTSGQFGSWGKSGPGEVATYFNPKHMVMSIGSRLFGTGDGTGPHWLKGGPAARFSAPFSTRHIGQAGQREGFDKPGEDGDEAEEKQQRLRHGGHFSVGQMVTLAKRAGFPDPALAAAIGYAESKGNASARRKTSKEDSRGLWQINLKAHRDKFKGWNLYDAFRNVRAAFRVSKGGKDWKPWSMYTSGGYRDFLGHSGMPLPKGKGSPEQGGSKFTDYLEMRMTEAEHAGDPDEQRKVINRAMRYWRGVARRNKKTGNFQRRNQALQELITLRAKKKELFPPLEEEEDLFELGGLSTIGTGPNAFNIGGMQRTFDQLNLRVAEAGLTQPADGDDSPGALARSLADDITAATDLASVWQSVYTLTKGVSIPKPHSPGLTFDPTPAQTRALNKTRNQTERIALLKKFASDAGYNIDPATGALSLKPTWIVGTIKQQIDAATELSSAREALKGFKDEAGGTAEAAEAQSPLERALEVGRLLASLRELIKQFGSNIKPVFAPANLPKFHEGGTIQGPRGSEQVVKAEGGEFVVRQDGKNLKVIVQSPEQERESKVVNQYMTFTTAPEDQHAVQRFSQFEARAAV